MRFLYTKGKARLVRILFVLSFLFLPLAFAYASTSVSIGSLSPGTTVAAGTSLSFTVSTSGFTSPVFAVSDSFNGSSASTNDIDSGGHFIWTPNANDVGTHTLTINITDSAGDSSAVQEVVTVASSAQTNPTIAIQGLTPGTAVVLGNSLTFIAAASSFTNPTFTLSDSFAGSSLSNSNITSAGYFSWTPTASQLGTHTITVYATDSQGHSANVVEQILVENPNITVTSISPGNNVNPGSTVNFTLTQAGLVNPNYSLSDSFSGTAGNTTNITNADLNSSGYFAWTPDTTQVGTHQLLLSANDSQGHTATTSINLYVIQAVQVALTAPSPSSTVAPGTAVTLTAAAYAFTNPRFALSDAFPNTTLTNANISSTGIVTWTPTAADVGTHTITISASDTYSHLASAQTTITVAGTPVTTASQTTTTTTSTSSATSGYQFTTYLSPGITSQDVTELQTILAQQGYFTGSATGYYGPQTEAAVIKYQAAHGLNQLGVVGPATRAALNGGTPSIVSAAGTATSGYVFNNFLNVGSSGPDVTALQQKLTSLNLYSGPVTGYFGSLTQAAVEAFQGQNNISQVGYVGPSTRAALNK